MRYIFPKNYNFKNKIFGIIDYTTAIFNVLIFVFLFSIINLIFKSINLKIILIIIIYLPIFLFSIIGFNNENILYIIFFIIKYLIKPKLYLYK